MANLFLEAESFAERGGWVIDCASMHKMGSAYLMAHGAGVPVADAVTEINLERDGVYSLYVRTRDWSAVWGRGTSAGRFQVLLDGADTGTVFGTNGAEWAWQNGGKVTLTAGKHTISLHDLTGFNGRCDALYLTDDPQDVPPDDGEALEQFRRERCGIVVEDVEDEYDLVVAGGGIAGIVTALAAARLGLRSVCLQDRPVPGGCNSSEIRVPLGGLTHVGPYPNLGNTVREIAPIFLLPGAMAPECYEDNRKIRAFQVHCAGKAELRLNERVVRIETDPDDPALIRSVITRSTVDGSERRCKGRLFSDCTGDGTVAYAAGASFMYGTEGREVFGESLTPPETIREVMGLSVLWTSVEEAAEQPFPDIDWGVEFTEENCYYRTSGDWETETGQYRDQAEEIEYIRDYSLMTTFGNWSYLKNHSAKKADFARRRIDWISSCGGKRESRRFIGDTIMTQQDIEEQRKPVDGTGCITWSIDLHYPEPENLRRFAEPFRSCAYHRCLPDYAPVPYRCLYSKDVKNLFLGGRLISLSHVAFSAVRVMRTLGVLGEVVAMAAKVCCEKDVLPREVGTEHLDRLKELMSAGVPVPEEFHCSAIGGWESYHFKEIGHLSYNGSGRTYDLPEQLQKDIQQLKRDHLHPETGK